MTTKTKAQLRAEEKLPQLMRRIHRGRPASPDFEQRVVAAAGRLFQRGVASVALKDIARDAGVSLGGLQHHYPHKRQLVGSVADLAMREAPKPCDGETALAWARLWVSLRAAASEDHELKIQLDQLDGAHVHEDRCTALVRLVVEDTRNLFASGTPILAAPQARCTCRPTRWLK